MQSRDDTIHEEVNIQAEDLSILHDGESPDAVDPVVFSEDTLEANLPSMLRTSSEELRQDDHVDAGDDLKGIIEALVFASDEPITFRQLKDVIVGASALEESSVQDDEETGDNADDTETPIGDVPPSKRSSKKNGESSFTLNQLKTAIARLNDEYQQHGHAFRIIEVAGGFSFQTISDYGVHVGKLFTERTKRRLTQSALETLAIIAFKQPISKPAVEAIRGVNADYVLKSLLERNLIAIDGRDNSVGRPLLYGTTKTFLKHFGLSSLDDLPKPREIQELLETERDAIESSIEKDAIESSIEKREGEETFHRGTNQNEVNLFDTLHDPGATPDLEPSSQDKSEIPESEKTNQHNSPTHVLPELTEMGIEKEVVFDLGELPKHTPAFGDEPSTDRLSLASYNDDDFDDEEDFDDDLDDVDDIPDDFEEDDFEDEDDDFDDDVLP